MTIELRHEEVKVVVFSEASMVEVPSKSSGCWKETFGVECLSYIIRPCRCSKVGIVKA